MKRLLLSVFVSILVSPLAAQTDVESLLAERETQQRAWIQQERARYQAQSAAQEIACYQRFAVNDCLNDSRRKLREALADLRRQEIVLNDAQRKRRAAQKLLRSDEKSPRLP